MSRANNDPHPRQQPSPHSFARAEEASGAKEYHIFGSRFVPFVESNRVAAMSALGQKQAFTRCPLYPQKRTLKLSRVMSALCQKQTLRRLLGIID
jgi:hypothetical protein